MRQVLRGPGLLLAVAGVMWGMEGWAWSQQTPQPATLPLTLPPPTISDLQPNRAPGIPAVTLPIIPNAATFVIPGIPQSSTGPAKAASSIKGIVVEMSAGQTLGNPTGRQEPGVSLEWVYPSTARLGQQIVCTLIVKSLGTNRIHDVVIHTRIPAGAQVQGTEPKAAQEDDLLIWNLGPLEPRQEKRLDIQLVPQIKGSFACHAFVTFTGTATAKLYVREPKLAMKATGPKQAVTGDPAPVTVIVTNPGDAPAEKVKVRAVLSDGLEHSRGQIAEFTLDNLGPGESRTVLVLCAAKAIGAQTCSVSASADPQLSCNGSVGIEVVAPRLAVAVTGPALRYLERHAILNFKVTNPGTAPANHVTLTEHVPLGYKVVAASGGGRHDFVSRSVVWVLDDLNPGQSKEVSLELVAINPGEYRHKAVVTAARGLRAESELLTRVEGLSALLMELVDTDDPVEVGKDTSYEVRVTNTGTKTETNLQLTCTIPDKMEVRGAKGAFGCAYKQVGRELVFAPLPKLPPRADAIYRVTVKCQAAGDLRFQARVRADGLALPVLREESTRVYGDEVETPIRPSKK